MAKRSFWNFLFGSDEPSSAAGSADKATERLKVIVASQNRSLNSRLDDARIQQMKREILQIVNKYVNGVNMDNVNISHRKEESIDLLEMSINLPEQEKKKAESEIQLVTKPVTKSIT